MKIWVVEKKTARFKRRAVVKQGNTGFAGYCTNTR
jgi:hypothetical protein